MCRMHFLFSCLFYIPKNVIPLSGQPFHAGLCSLLFYCPFSENNLWQSSCSNRMGAEVCGKLHSKLFLAQA